jgi:hypothetical protein
MKSAYELAMERLQKEDPDSSRSFTEEEKTQLAEIDTTYKAKIAEREVFLNKQALEARRQGDGQAITQIETQLRNERARLKSECEVAKDKIRKTHTAE